VGPTKEMKIKEKPQKKNLIEKTVCKWVGGTI
jgi:hypothetical protein